MEEKNKKLKNDFENQLNIEKIKYIEEKNKNKVLEEKIKENEKKYNESINNKDNELKIKEDKIKIKHEKLLELSKKLKDNKKEMNEYKRKYNELIGNSNKNAQNEIKYEKCFEEPIIGYRYKCPLCNNYNLCQKCQE